MGGDICKLCLKESELQNSHILPEFFYSATYNDLHRTLEITRDAERNIQKGLREYLPCQECETKLSRYEGYAVKITRSIPSFQNHRSGRYIYLENVDYLQSKLFQLSLLWRASVSKNSAFLQVNLGPHEEILRSILSLEAPCKSSDYGCIMMTMLNTELLHKVIASSTRVKPKPFGHAVYKFMTGNLTWLFFVTGHHVNIQIQEFFLQEIGILRIWLASNEENAILNFGKNLDLMEPGRSKP